MIKDKKKIVVRSKKVLTQKLSVSLSQPLCDFVENYQEQHHYKSRSDVISKALQLLNQKQFVSVRVPILMYHYVEYIKDTNDTIRKSLNIIPSIFEEQIKTLKNDGYTFRTADGTKSERAKTPVISNSSGFTFTAEGAMMSLREVRPSWKRFSASKSS